MPSTARLQAVPFSTAPTFIAALLLARMATCCSHRCLIIVLMMVARHQLLLQRPHLTFQLVAAQHLGRHAAASSCKSSVTAAAHQQLRLRASSQHRHSVYGYL